MVCKNIFVLIFILLFLFSSCKKTTEVPPTPADSRLKSITHYYNNNYNGIEKYQYNDSGILLSHTVDDALYVELKKYIYIYDAVSRVAGITYHENGSSSVNAVFTYDGSGLIGSSASSDAGQMPIFNASFFYDTDFHIIRKDLYAPLDLVNIFYYTTNDSGLVVQELITDASSTAISSTVLQYNAEGSMMNKYFYDMNGVMTAQITCATNIYGIKTNMYYTRPDTPGTLWHGVYSYETGVTNIDENMSDYYENVCLNLLSY